MAKTELIRSDRKIYPEGSSVIVFCLFVFFVFPHFGFKTAIWLLIAPVPVHCFSITLTQ